MPLNRDEFVRYQRGIKGPSWRARIAAHTKIRGGTRQAEVADELLMDFSKYLRIKGGDGPGNTRAAKLFPIIAAAERLNEDHEKTAVLKLMVAADMSHDEKHARSDVEISILKTWESLFFDARGQRQATGWLAHNIIEPELKAGNPELASKLKVALMAGPIAVRGMLDMQSGVCLDEGDRLFQRRIKLNEKFDVAVNLPVDSERSQLFFMKLHVSLMAAEKRQALAEQKLAQRCAEARDRVELEKLRLEQAAEFQAVRRSEKMSKAERRAVGGAARRQATQELKRYQEQAHWKAVQCRVAESPLARLRWSSQPVVAFEGRSHGADADPTIVSITGYQAMKEVIEDMNELAEKEFDSEQMHEPLLVAI
ncbi:MAG: hypothetical protein K8U03_22215 [Planctomycetia bacterium]|nr:hypothetical protein [Planctomycetia bacterium]